MSDIARVTRAGGTVGAATFLSRIFGYVRDMVLAGFFGAAVFQLNTLTGQLLASFLPAWSSMPPCLICRKARLTNTCST